MSSKLSSEKLEYLKEQVNKLAVLDYLSGLERKEDRREESKFLSCYTGKERREEEMLAMEKARKWREQMRREQQRDRFAYALRMRAEQREKNGWFSKYRELLKKKINAEIKLIKNKQERSDKIRLARALALFYNLDLSIPHSIRLMLWRKELFDKNNLKNRPRPKVRKKNRNKINDKSQGKIFSLYNNQGKLDYKL